MDLKTHRSALSLLNQIADRKNSTVPRVETPPQKPPCRCDAPMLQPFPRTSPEAQGIPSAHIAGFLRDLNDLESLDLHSIMILRHGAVIAETGICAYDQRVWHITHSQCKSITGLAIGMLIDEGKLSLDDKVVKIFEDRAAVISLLTHKNITVRHLLTMTSGVVFNEAGAVTETDWVKCFLESAVRTEPGKKFTYNSMNTYMLSAIVRQVSGQGLMAYLEDRLWKPLGITEIFWETCPQGIEKGGWGLYIRPEDIAKIGQLVLQKGLWAGQQLVSVRWAEEAASVQMETPTYLGDYHYGYQIWVGRRRKSFLFNGMFGQNVLGLPDIGVLVVTTAGNSELFQQNGFYSLVDRYFPDDLRQQRPLSEDPDAHRQLQALQNRLQQSAFVGKGSWSARYTAGINTLDPTALCSELDGRTYLADSEESAAVGLLPLMAQVIQNNYTRGFMSLTFAGSEDDFYLTLTENDASYRLPVGFSVPKHTDLDFHGEIYKVGVTGKFAADEDGSLVLVLRISFLEIANSRILKIFFHGDAILIRWLESPGRQFLIEGLVMLKNEIKSYPFIAAMLSRLDQDLIGYKIRRALEPETTARLKAGTD
ncbi:MAG TPA: hypothetical protein DD640_06380 [Clostridiales bacterium]|nr:hypothetical protein [Clostridiales bacterium]